MTSSHARCSAPRRHRTRRRLAAALGSALVLAACSGGGAPPPDEAEADGWVTIRGERVAIEVVDDPASQRKGLGERDKLDWGRGMLFVYERMGFHRFWMKGMRFPIDIVWIRDGRIVFVSHRVPHEPGVPDRELRTYQSPEAVDRVLEVPAGYAEAYGWGRGDRVSIEIAEG